MKLYLFGGRPCSGKTTLAYNLGQLHNIEVWYLDVFAQKCIEKATIETPHIYEWKNKDMIEILQKEPNVLFKEYVNFYEELFPLLLEELESVDERSLILEGSILLPKFIDILREKYDVKICYMLTDDEFVKEKYIKRDYAQDMITKPKGKVALNNLLERDSLFAKYILDEVNKYSLPNRTINSDSDTGKELMFIEKLFEL